MGVSTDVKAHEYADAEALFLQALKMAPADSQCELSILTDVALSYELLKEPEKYEKTQRRAAMLEKTLNSPLTAPALDDPESRRRHHLN